MTTPRREIAALDQLTAAVGEALVAEMCGTWLGRNHRDRPRLQFERPKSPARAPHYLAFVRELPCKKCGKPAEPHHDGPRGVSQKADDYRTVPLCRDCHELAHHGQIAPGAIRIWMIDTLVAYLRVVEQT